MKLNNPDLLRQANYLNGQWVPACSENHIKVHNPSTNTLIGYVPNLGSEAVSEVIYGAHEAWTAYKKLTAKERADLLFRLRKQIVDNKDDLATIISAEVGKPLKESYAEIISSANSIEWFAEEVKRIYGETIPPHVHEKRLMTIKQPIGVVGAITPWNFPSSIVTRKCAPALAAGCPIIIKPAPETPFSALALGYLAEQAGFPKGVINIITGDAATIAEAMCENPLVRMISFTGSTTVGKQLACQAAKTVKKITLELGGNAPFIVFEDADIDKAVEGTVACKFRNSGQTCISGNRFYIHESIYDKYLKCLLKRIEALKIGDAFEKDTVIGPLINQQAIEKAKALLDNALDKGAKLIKGG